MNESEKINFLSEKIKELNKVTQEIEGVFPEKSFTLDGILVGNIVEVMSAHIYGITLYKQSEKTHDGEVDGKKVQIKGTQGKNSIVIREEPEYLIVEYLDKENGAIKEIYNGPGAMVWEYRSFVPSINCYTISVNKLLELDCNIQEKDRIPPIVPIDKYFKNRTVIRGEKGLKGKKSTGKTLILGYINRNQQENRGCLNKPGNHYNQMAYKMKCLVCGFEYEANGCDVALRKCPKCIK